MYMHGLEVIFPNTDIVFFRVMLPCYPVVFSLLFPAFSILF